MTDDLERIGGISVEIAATDSRLASDLAAAEDKIKAWTERVSAQVSASFTVTTPQAQANAGVAQQSSAPAESAIIPALEGLSVQIERLSGVVAKAGGVGATAREARQQRVEAETLTIQGVRVGRLSQQQQSLQSAIDQQLGGETELPVEVSVEDQPVEQATRRVRDLRVETEQPISITGDFSDLREGLAALTGELRQLRELAAQPIVLTSAPAAEGGPGTVQRAPEPETMPTAALVAEPPGAQRATRPSAQPPAAEGEETTEAPRERRRPARTGDVGTAYPEMVRTYEPSPGYSDVRSSEGYLGPPTLAGTRATPTRSAAWHGGLDVEPEQVAEEASQLNESRRAAVARERTGDAETQRLIRRLAGNLDRLEAGPQQAPDWERIAEQAQQAEAYSAGARPSEGFAPTFAETGRTPEQARRDREQAEAAARANVDQGAAEEQRRREATATPPPVDAYRNPRDEERARREQEQRNVSMGAQAERERVAFGIRQQRGELSRRLAEEQAVRRMEQQQATAEAQITAAGRTPRTLASTLGAFFGGPRKEQIEAQAALTKAQRDTAAATRYRNIFEQELIRNSVRAETATRDEAIALRDRNREIRRSTEYRGAIEGQTQAIEREGEATQRVAKLSQGLGVAARSLIAVTAGGAAFGAGLAAISVAMDAAQRAATPYFDRLTGYATKTADLTSALADQTRAQQGNVEGVVALRLAQSGFAADAARMIQPLISQRAQIEAGNKAIQEQIDTFRVAENLRRQGAMAGLGGGTGGVLGTGMFGIPGTGEQYGNFLQSLNDAGQWSPLDDLVDRLTSPDSLLSLPNKIARGIGGLPEPPDIVRPGTVDQEAISRGLEYLNEQLRKGAGEGEAPVEFRRTGNEVLVEETAQAFDRLSPPMAAAIRELGLYSEAISGTGDVSIATKTRIEQATRALEDLNAAANRIGSDIQMQSEKIRQYNVQQSVPAMLEQIQYESTAFQNMLDRQQNFALTTQIPAQTALGAMAQPAVAPGTGIVAANAKEQATINEYQQETIDLQKQLNTYYDSGRKILADTYKIPQQTLGSIQNTGQQIASIQAGISNQQAAYATAQYNYQLFIARRTLSDIAGLTGQASFGEASRLGILERQNLLLSRQAQQLQFGLSQRQINLQTAIAGFTVPGLTPAEQNARVREAEIEAKYAQKQLDIQKQMFRNQVKIVDIGNLRQGADLLKQIGLLQQGRAVSINTALAQQKLERLHKMQQILVEEAGTYLSKVNAQTSKSISDMHRIEAALGKNIETSQEKSINAANRVGRAWYQAGYAFFLGLAQAPMPKEYQRRGGPPDASENENFASGFLGTVSGATNMIMGEAGTETVAILRNPKALLGNLMAGGGGTTVNFNGDITVRTAADIDEIARKVSRVMGREASLRGLRGPN